MKTIRLLAASAVSLAVAACGGGGGGGGSTADNSSSSRTYRQAVLDIVAGDYAVRCGSDDRVLSIADGRVSLSGVGSVDFNDLASVYSINHSRVMDATYNPVSPGVSMLGGLANVSAGATWAEDGTLGTFYYQDTSASPSLVACSGKGDKARLGFDAAVDLLIAAPGQSMTCMSAAGGTTSPGAFPAHGGLAETFIVPIDQLNPTTNRDQNFRYTRTNADGSKYDVLIDKSAAATVHNLTLTSGGVVTACHY